MTCDLGRNGASQIYETDRSLGEYLLFHYGSKNEQFPWPNGPSGALEFAKRSVLELVDKDASVGLALDLGCAVGKSTFVLAGISQKVLGIDLSGSFIGAAQTLLETGRLNYEYHEEGNRWKKAVVEIEEIPVNMSFEVGDACNLRENINSFDLVHAANLLCRLPDPMKLLNKLPELVAPGGQLLITTPFTWLEDFTPKEKWLNGEDSASALKEILSGTFDLEMEKNLPFLIREHRRKFQYTISLGMRWRRKQTS